MTYTPHTIVPVYNGDGTTAPTEDDYTCEACDRPIVIFHGANIHGTEDTYEHDA